MARLHYVKKARKPIKAYDIKKGDSYYWWKFNFSPVKHCSKTQPTRSQLTQSEFLGQIYDLEDRIGKITADMDLEDIKSEVEDIVSEIRNLGEEQSSKRDNMPQQLQDSGSGETLQNRYDSCEEFASELEGLDLEVEDTEEAKQSLIEDIQAVSYNGE